MQAHLLLWGLNQQVYLLHLPQTRSYVPILIPNQRAGMHNCTRSSGLYVTVASDQLFNLFTISMYYRSVSILSYRHPCKLHLYPTIRHVCNNCIQSCAMSFTVAPNQQSCLLNLHLQACPSDTIALDQHL